MNPLDKKYDTLGMAVILGIVAGLLLCVLATCSVHRAYLVTFSNGNTDCYYLDYKPGKGDNYVKYNGDTYLGVKKIEKIK